MYYVYLLKSKVDGRIYVGFSSDLRKRVMRHNDKKVRSTKAYAPWELIYYEAYKARADASRREKQLKMHAAKSEVIGRLTSSVAGE